MPLRAFVNEIETISIDLDNERWSDLKKLVKSHSSVVRLPCCNQNGYLRTSSTGLKHFVHSNSRHNCDWKPESAEHLKSKIEIIEACKESGWKAIPEFSENNWRADVLAIRGKTRIAFEVQWSRQTLEETKFRQERYRNSSVRGCWLFRTAPKEMRKFVEPDLKADNEIPAFKIFIDENSNIQAQMNSEQLSLRSLVNNLLNRKLKICKKIRVKTKQEVEIIFFETVCWKCEKPQHLWTVEQNLIAACDLPYLANGNLWNCTELDKNPAIHKAVLEILKTNAGSSLSIGTLKHRFQKKNNKSILSHGCFFCDSIFSDYYLKSEKIHSYYDTRNIRKKVDLEMNDLRVDFEHWCFSENGDFCE